MNSLTRLLLIGLLIASLFVFVGCGDDDDDDSGTPTDDDDDITDDDTVDDDDDTVDDDDATDDDDDITDDDDDVVDDDDDSSLDLRFNPNAKADAFRLFYRERTERTLLSLNRFGIGGDAVFATNFGKMWVAQNGNEYEVVVGPKDNNPIGMTVYTTWQMYKAIGGRELELTLIRLFEGLVFNEQVSGYSGLTCREALPGWTRVMDGVNDTITRTRMGLPIVPPMSYPPALEQEILDTFYDGVVFTYRENPEEYYFNFKAINELENFAITYVFDELPYYLRISDCCSSWMISRIGDWQGAFWGNHNSRDNFTDYAMGYLAALDAESTSGLPADLAQAAANAADAARRTGTAIADAGMIQETVSEHLDYNTLIPGGQVRPDTTVEWQDLGSLANCQMVYVAQALSESGLSYPVPELPLPGAIEHSAIQLLFDTLGLPLQAPDFTCKGVDDAYFGMTWGEMLKGEIFGIPWYDWAHFVSLFLPDLLPDLLGGTHDDFRELLLGAVNLCYYAQIVGDDALYDAALDDLKNLLGMTYHLTDLVYGASKTASDAKQAAKLKVSAEEMYFLAALYSRMFDLDSPLEDFNNFSNGDSRVAWVESQLSLGDTSEWPLIDDTAIQTRIMNRLAGRNDEVRTRYEERFGADVPVRRNGNGYECIGSDGNWQATENSRHRHFDSYDIWREVALCNNEVKHTLDCSWASLGCEAVDLDGSGVVDTEDLILFNDAFALYGMGATCDSANDYCDGADTDQSGTLELDDRDFLNAAQGCYY